MATFIGVELNVPATASTGFWDSGALSTVGPNGAIGVSSAAVPLDAARAGVGAGQGVALDSPTMAAIPKAKYANLCLVAGCPVGTELPKP